MGLTSMQINGFIISVRDDNNEIVDGEGTAEAAMQASSTSVGQF